MNVIGGRRQNMDFEVDEAEFLLVVIALRFRAKSQQLLLPFIVRA